MTGLSTTFGMIRVVLDDNRSVAAGRTPGGRIAIEFVNKPIEHPVRRIMLSGEAAEALLGLLRVILHPRDQLPSEAIDPCHEIRTEVHSIRGESDIPMRIAREATQDGYGADPAATSRREWIEIPAPFGTAADATSRPARDGD